MTQTLSRLKPLFNWALNLGSISGPGHMVWGSAAENTESIDNYIRLKIEFSHDMDREGTKNNANNQQIIYGLCSFETFIKKQS